MSGRTPAGGSADRTRPPLARLGSSSARGPTLSTAARPGSSASVRSATSSTAATAARQPLRMASVDENKRPTLNGVSRRMSSMNSVPTTSRPSSRLSTTSSSTTRTPTTTSRTAPRAALNSTPRAPLTSTPRAPLNSTPRATAAPTTINRTPRLAATANPDTPKTPSTAPKAPTTAPKATTPRKLAVRTSLGKMEKPILSSPVALSSDLKSSSDRPPSPLGPMFKSPPKLRKYSAVSDVDTDQMKQKSHARSQSATVGRPSTAPETQEQKLRDMRIMGDLLREANVREAMKEEIAELKAEVERLQRPKSPVKPDTWAGTFTVAEMEEMEASHLEEVQGIRGDYERQRRATEEEHATEMRGLRAELDQMETMKAEHEKILAAAHAKLEAESKELKKTSAMLRDLKNTHAKELQELKTEHASVAENLRNDHNNEIKELKSQLEVQRKRAASIDKLKA
ncbi:hypothetical protein KCV02_g19854, partial [Aureobasidium melanogenum]